MESGVSDLLKQDFAPVTTLTLSYFFPFPSVLPPHLMPPKSSII